MKNNLLQWKKKLQFQTGDIMKVTLQGNKPSYPYLGINQYDLERDDPMIILFTRPKHGTVLAANCGYSHTIGLTEDWDETAFVPYKDEIILKNW